MQATAINHQAAAGRITAPHSAAAAASGSGSSSSPQNTTITANDFLTLLVAEMKNQDPTSTQDPNAYIDQLVQVNSLQQLISINQDLGTSKPATSASGSPQSVSPVGHTSATAREAGTVAAVSAAEERLKAGSSIDAASRLETALAPKSSSDQPLGYSPGSNDSVTTAAGFKPSF